MFQKRIAIIALLLVLALSLTACQSGSSPAASDQPTASAYSEADNTFSYWIPEGADSSYYADYSQNPGVSYALAKKWGEEGSTLGFDFIVPVSGEERNNFNTLLSTGDYADVMTLTYYDGSVMDLYDEGVILDLTDYVEKYMPNYTRFLSEHPEYAQTATNTVDGKKVYLQLFSYMPGTPDAWGGYMYRRDWLVKYGANPTDGSAFTGDYAEKNADGTPNLQTWSDNVVFPSGGTDPIYISDWEWMLDIFAKAIQAEGIADGYCMSLYYPGYMETGELVSAFGGGGGHWYKNQEGKAVFGATGDGFRTYLQCMSKWYRNGWIDTSFPEHSTDMYYLIDSTKVAQGKVGLWFGTQSQLVGSLDTGDYYTSGIVAYSASMPINDVYGGDAQKNVAPYTFLTSNGSPIGIVISDKAKDKNLPALFSLLDYMYTQEGSYLTSFGLSKAQTEETQNELYLRYGLTDGAYYEAGTTATGQTRYRVNPILASDAKLADAVRSIWFFGLDAGSQKDVSSTATYRHNLDQWIRYANTGRFSADFNNLLAAEDQSAISKTQNKVREFMNKNIPNFIRGGKDPYSDEDWTAFVKALSKYQPDAVTAIYQQLLDSLQ